MACLEVTLQILGGRLMFMCIEALALIFAVKKQRFLNR